MMRNFLAVLSFAGIIMASLVPYAFAGTQEIFFSTGEMSILPGQSQKVDVLYNITDAEKLTTGVGIRIHFDSRFIENLSFSSLVQECLIGFDLTAREDTEDLDRNTSTNWYISAAWMSLDGRWPNADIWPVKIGEIVIEVRADAAHSETALNVTASGTPVGYRAQHTGLSVRIP